MRRPLYGSNLAPRDDGGLYAVLHCCDGEVWTSGWPWATAVDIATLENRLQSTDAELCAQGDLCLGHVVWRGARGV